MSLVVSSPRRRSHLRDKKIKEWDRFYHSGHKLFCCLTERERWEGRKQIKLNKKHRSCPPFLDSISRFSVWLCFSRSVGVCVERVCVCLLHCAAVESPSLSQLLLLFGGHRILLAFFCFYFLSFFFLIMLGVPEWKWTDRGGKGRDYVCDRRAKRAAVSQTEKSESSPHPWPCACLWSS